MSLPVTSQSFYVTGGSLPRDAVSYIRRQADETLLASLMQGEFCYILTSRQMGKSSLMIHTVTHLQEAGVQTGVIDLTSLGQNLTAEQWYKGMLNRLGSQLDLEYELDDFWLEHETLPPLQRWMTALQKVILPAPIISRKGAKTQREEEESQNALTASIENPSSLVIFIDEIDMVRSLPFPTDEFFAAIRACYNRRDSEPEFKRLTFCLLGVASPSDLIQDVHITPFNIGRRIELHDFTPQEASSLSVGLSVSGRSGEALLNRVLYWTGGHPYLTQRLCAEIAEQPNVLMERDVDHLCEALFFAPDSRQSESNLSFVANRLLKSGSDLFALLELYRLIFTGKPVQDDPANPLCEVLRLSGIVRKKRGRLEVRNRIYEHVFKKEWILANMPDAELQRQSVARLKGFLQATLLFGAIAMILAVLGWVAFVNAKRATKGEQDARQSAINAKNEAQRANQYLYMADMNLVQMAWDETPAQIIRILQLLEETKNLRERNFEWGYWKRLCHQDLITLKGHAFGVDAVAISSDGKRIVTGSYDQTAKVWDVQTGKEILNFTLKHTKSVTSVAISSDGKRIITGSADNTAKVWDAQTGKEILTLKGHKDNISFDHISSVAISSDSKRIVTGSWGYNNTAKVWDAQTGKEILTLQGYVIQISSVAFSPDGNKIVTGSHDGTAKVWDVQSGKEILTLKHAEWVESVAFSPDGLCIAAGGGDNTAEVWDAQTGNEILMLRHADFISSVAFSPDSKRIVTGSNDKMAKLWDSQTGKEILILKGHLARISSVAFSADGRTIVTGSDDNTVKIWIAD